MHDDDIHQPNHFEYLITLAGTGCAIALLIFLGNLAPDVLLALAR